MAWLRRGTTIVSLCALLLASAMPVTARAPGDREGVDISTTARGQSLIAQAAVDAWSPR